MTDAVWWFYLFWFPKFMNEQFGVDIKTIGLPMITVYLLADVGSIAGGWQSSWLLKRGWSANAARKTAMLTCALCVVPVVAAPLVQGSWYIGDGWSIDAKWVAVLLIGVAAAAHQGFSANLFTLTSDMFPRRAVGSVVGIGGFAGAIGGVIMNLSAGYFKDLTGNYIVMFAAAASAYLLALLVIHLLVPRLEPVDPTAPLATPELAIRSSFCRFVASFDRVGFGHVLARLCLAVPQAALFVVLIANKVDPHHAFFWSSREADRHLRFDFDDDRLWNPNFRKVVDRFIGPARHDLLRVLFANPRHFAQLLFSGPIQVHECRRRFRNDRLRRRTHHGRIGEGHL